MFSNIFQKFTIFFREKYINSLKSFEIAYNLKIKKEVYSNLSEEIKNTLDIYTKVYANLKKEMGEEKKHWNNMVKETSGKSNALKDLTYKALLHDPAKRQVLACDRAIEKMGSKVNLYLARFDEDLTSREAKFKLLKIGLEPANILETVLFFQKYKDDIINDVPIIVLEAYLDAYKKIGVKKDGLYGLCLCLHSNSEDIKFARIGAMEYGEFRGNDFRKRTPFLVKSL